MKYIRFKCAVILLSAFILGKYNSIFSCTKSIFHRNKSTLENTEGEVKNGQSRETENVGYRRRGKNKTKTQQNI